MNLRSLLIPLPVVAILLSGCSDTATESSGTPVVSEVAPPKKTDRGNVIKKHTIPVGADPDAIAPGP